MRTFIKNYLAAEKARREENGEAGFSLIELIVVVVILGILAAIAVPVFLGLQAQAEKTSQDAVAGNAASQLASEIAQDPDYAFDADDFASLAGDTYTITTNTYTSIDDFCVSVTGGADDWTSKAGPGADCTSAAS
ncbi:type II secretion system protein [Microbacterium fluvii]|uniref:Type II secretion system protein n=1 Tax=Microbacterium fluvii TaxID=415215 RepID=A0ABW2HKB4_9MICO|nr:type II secretion system protein [Microbacterium fluvii]